LEWSKFVSAYVKRNKKIFKKFDFCTCPPAHLIDFAPLTAEGFLGGKKSIKNTKHFLRVFREAYLVFSISLVEACGVVLVLFGRLIANMRQ